MALADLFAAQGGLLVEAVGAKLNADLLVALKEQIAADLTLSSERLDADDAGLDGDA